MTKSPSQETSNVLNAVWDVVRERSLAKGDQLPSIRELADRLSVKQTVIRDALLKAESMGLVKILPRAGVFLRVDDPRDKKAANFENPVSDALNAGLIFEEPNVLHLLDARRLIEIELVGRAAANRRLEDLLPARRALDAMLQLAGSSTRSEYVQFDVRFHVEIARLGGNPVLLTIQKSLMELLVPYLNQVPEPLQRRGKTDRSHIAIYEALVAGDSEKARNEMREHLSLAYDSLLQDIQRPPASRSLSERNRPVG